MHGTTGEGVSLAHEEKKSLTKAWIDARAKASLDHSFLLMINVTSCVASETLDHAKYCDEKGVDAIAFLPPFYYRLPSVQHLTKYMSLIASAAPETPLVYYHFPEMTKVDFPLNQLLGHVIEEVPSFTGLKYTCKDIVQLTNIHREFGKRVKLFVGYEESLLAGIAIGLDSGICAQFNFRQCVQNFRDIVENVAGNPEKAADAQSGLAAVAKELASGCFIANVKRKLSLNMDVGGPRPPILE